MPTGKCLHYLRGLKGLSKEERSVLDLHMLPPVVGDGEQSKLFWQQWCGNDVVVDVIKDGERSLEEIELEVGGNEKAIHVYELHSPQHWPIRPAFKALSLRERDEVVKSLADDESAIRVSLKGDVFNDLNYVLPAMGFLAKDVSDRSLSIPLEENAKVMSLMLGSNGGKSIYDYVRAIVKESKLRHSDA